ncbi:MULTISPECIES: protein adenylyltransferase SelO [Bacillaceae]|uniref:Protein nucleotidyltransferase YdiU n=1 Tax=Evansella alkalicola TaxID=745819 RepID=A0ABS6JWL2_9BACI|nr:MULTISPECIES: YdiU family protein [Bacillaceae]MBU9722981.1 YdiU family protein [Bacillus alkalicola]
MAQHQKPQSEYAQHQSSFKKGWNLENSYTTLPDMFHSAQKPVPVRAPKLIKLNESLGEALGLDVNELTNDKGVQIFAGNDIPEGSEPISQAYAGHQFGNFTMLGDGRAVLLGEQITPNGERVDIQLKGSGRTPYSRGGDGRATLGPMLREYIISEAMHGLGIPTTRSLAVVTTGETVMRERVLPGAILTRVASSHIRFGTFEYARRFCSEEDLKALADYTIERHYPQIKSSTENHYLVLLQEVIQKYASLLSKWQAVGFIHGVMNTDNMTLSGETIDYGPCAFMDSYDPETVFSSIDREGRYAYGNQPYIGSWNLSRFAETLLPLLHEDEETAVNMAQKEIATYKEHYFSEWFGQMRAKLGIFDKKEEDEALISDLLQIMKGASADYTNTFRALTQNNLDVLDLFEKPEFKSWHERWEQRRREQEESEEDSYELMRKTNPQVIPRNHLVEEALDAAVEKEDFSVLESLLDVLTNPFDFSKEQGKYCSPAASNAPYRTYCGT